LMACRRAGRRSRDWPDPFRDCTEEQVGPVTELADLDRVPSLVRMVRQRPRACPARTGVGREPVIPQPARGQVRSGNGVALRGASVVGLARGRVAAGRALVTLAARARLPACLSSATTRRSRGASW
jgi:hypothetical protein